MGVVKRFGVGRASRLIVAGARVRVIVWPSDLAGVYGGRRGGTRLNHVRAPLKAEGARRAR